MRPACVLAILTVCCSCITVRAEDKPEKKTIEIGGLRQVQAVVTTIAKDYLVEVRLLPVRSFDEGTNMRLNRDKARESALLALAKHLSDKPAVEFTVSGATVEKTGMDGQFYTLSLRVPRTGVSVARSDPEPKAQGKPDGQKNQTRVAFTSPLFTRKLDYLKTAAQLEDAAIADLEGLVAKYPDENEGKELLLRVAEIKKAALANFAQLVKEISGDLLLLTVEQEELGEALDRHRTKVLAVVNEITEKRRPDERKEKK
jgi:hypothetical protein